MVPFSTLMKLDTATVASASFDHLRPYARDNEEFYGAPGREHYRLLAHLAAQSDHRTLIDIGSHRGASALALSSNPTNRVLSFDVVDNVRPIVRRRSNVQFVRADLFDGETRGRWERELLESAVLFIDVDPHEGTREYALVQWLLSKNYQGLILLDDIWHFRAMRNECWYRLPSDLKVDLTTIGHWSGTGAISLSEQLEVAGQPRWEDLRNWTLVTGYFDLTGLPDASPAIQRRPATHYLDTHAHSTLALDVNLVVFCEPEQQERILALRPRELRDRTHVVPMRFEEFPLTRHRDQIIRNRHANWCTTDPRNTASYYLFCMARYAMLKQAIRDNPFGSDQFAWINICIERMGAQNLVRLPEALALNRKGFSTCYIDYASQTRRANLPDYFGPNGCQDCRAPCTMCSGFFTGGAETMRTVCDAMESQFLRCLAAGFGHSDEQLMNLVHLERPDLFDWYCGDYSEMVTNYAHVYERAEQPVFNVIRNSLAAGDLAVCSRACDIVWRSYVGGKCSLNDEALNLLLHAMDASSQSVG
jgi:predicted O-methyltransferase YrrM